MTYKLIQPLACVALAGVPLLACSEGADTAEKLNVLMIVIDDLRTELECYGEKGIHTPNIDRLARQGLLFNNAYAQYPVCNPSRSSFLSGLRPEETGIFDNEVPFRHRNPDTVALPQLFRQNGYYTAGLGKIFHLGVNTEGKTVHFEDPQSWEFFFNGEATKLGGQGEGRDLTDGKIPWCKWLAAEGDDLDQPDGQNAAEAVRILEETNGKPFFIGLGFHKPHDPFFAPKKYFDLYPEEEINLVVEPEDRSQRVPLAIPSGKDYDAFVAFTDKERIEFKRAYHACLSFTDAQIGKVLDTLDRLKLWDNTIVILMGDNGYHLGQHDWWNKVTVYESGARVPFMMWVPGAKGMGQKTQALIELIDIYPTLIDYAGLSAPHKLSGASFRPVLETPQLPGKAAACTQVTRGKQMGYSVRTERWRYTEWGVDGELGIELYDHDKDAGEYYNLSGNPEYETVCNQMKKTLNQVFKNRRNK